MSKGKVKLNNDKSGDTIMSISNKQSGAYLFLRRGRNNLLETLAHYEEAHDTAMVEKCRESISKVEYAMNSVRDGYSS